MASEEEKEGIAFDKQTYLISYYDEIAKIVQNIEHKYVYILNNTKDANFSTTLSCLTDKIDADKFTKLKTYQYNSLIPRIRLFRLEYNDDKTIKSQKQFIFQKDASYKIDNMLKPAIKNNCGIKSISWKLAGSNPVTAEKQIEVQMQFYFDSINAFSGGSYDSMVEAWNNVNDSDPFELEKFKFCDDETTTKNYWSLIFHPQYKNSKNEYDTFKFRIKAMVGWEDLGENIRQQLNLNDVEEQIKKLNYCFFLNLIKHQFTFNEDGSLQVTADYVASFENETNNYSFNILGNLPEKIKNLRYQKPSDFPNNNNIFSNDVEKVKEEFGISDSDTEKLNNIALNSSQEEIENLQKFFNSANNSETREKLLNCNNTPANIKTILSDNPEDENSKLAKQQEVLDKVSNISAAYVSLYANSIKRKHYSYFINKLLETNSENPKYFCVTLKPEKQETWKKWYNLKQGSNKPDFNSNTQADDSAIEEQKNETKNELDKEIYELETNWFDSSVQSLNDLADAALEWVSDPRDIKIVFTTYGCVVDTAYQVVYDHLSGFFESGVEESDKIEIAKELDRLKTILGNISDENQIFSYNTDTDNKNTNIKNLAFAPIEINLLKTFLINNMIKPKKETYTLFSFLKDALSSLVISGLNSFGKQNDEVDKYSNVSLASNVISLGNVNDEDPIRKNFLSINNKSILNAIDIVNNKSKLDPHFINFINTDHKYFYNYNLLYDKTLKDFTPNNDSVKDEEIGIYHYTYAQDYGLIKSINFSKIDQPYLKEAKAVGKQTFYLGQFRDVYNADITMIGNNIYYPGMMLYIRPSVETSTDVSKDKPNFSQITGIGGYYFVIQVESSITEEGYETKLKTIWHSDGYEEPVTSLSEEEQCNALLQDAGIISQDTNTNNQAILTAIDLVAEEAEQEQIDEQAREIGGGGLSGAGLAVTAFNILTSE